MGYMEQDDLPDWVVYHEPVPEDDRDGLFDGELKGSHD